MCPNLRNAGKGINKNTLRGARNWMLAFYSKDVLAILGLPPDHNKRINDKTLSRYKLREGNFQGAELQRADLRKADLRGAKLQKANLLGADLRGAKLQDADLTYTDLRGTDLRGANLDGANLRGAHLHGVTGLTEDALRRTKIWILAFYGNELRTTLELPPDHNQRIRNKNLSGYKLQGVNLKDADLSFTDLQFATFQGVNLKGANITSANLRGANLSGALGLTREQIESAFTDDTTQFPDNL
jgi:BTB/POZ domain-containing protein KCTD9